jgi:Bifunctional DNA primase/polymerase, N-terminal
MPESSDVPRTVSGEQGMLNKTTMFDAAVSYARKGISVFPCKPREKIPATKNGFYDATTDEDAGGERTPITT